VRRSLRARLTAAATVIIASGMMGAAVLLVWRLNHALGANLDAAVTGTVQTVAADASREPLPRPLPTEAEAAAVAQVIDGAGAVITSSSNVDGEPRLFAVRGGRGHPTLATVTGVPVGGAGVTYRVAALTASSSRGPVTVYAAVPTTEAGQSVSELVAALAVGVPAVITALALVGWLLVGRALRPVEAMRRQAASIPGDDLHRRLEPPPSDDELARLAGTLNDLLTRIEVANGRQRRFIADAAHELRSPLAALRAELEVTCRHPDPEAFGTIAASLLADTERLSRLVDDLLALARLDADPVIRREPVDLDDLVHDQVRRAGPSRRIDTTGVGAARVTGDPQALGRVVRNLLDNAVRHADSTVTVALSATGAAVTLVVADDGPGIAPGDRQRIFDRFTRLDDARSRDGGGSGLGLAIVRDVVTAHGGSVRVEDTAPGARFTVALPAGQV
jgi:signal transduction histidine kinase